MSAKQFTLNSAHAEVANQQQPTPALDPTVMEHKTETARSIGRSFTLDTLFLLLCYIDFPV